MAIWHPAGRLGQWGRSCFGHVTERKHVGRSPSRPSAKRLRLETLEAREMLASDVVFEMPAAGQYTVSVVDNSLVIRDASGAVLLDVAQADVATLTVLGTSGDDTLVLTETDAGLPQFGGDLSSGPGFASPYFLASGRVNADGTTRIGLHFEAREGENTLSISLLSARDVAYFVDAADEQGGKRGNVSINHALTLSFAGLTPQILPGLGGNLTIDISGSPDTTFLALRDDPGDFAGVGGNVLVGNGGFETTFFSGFESITIVGGPATNQFTLRSIDPETSVRHITVQGNPTSANTFEVDALLAGVDIQLIGGAGEDLFFIEQNADEGVTSKIELSAGAGSAGDWLHFVGNTTTSAILRVDSQSTQNGTLFHGDTEIALDGIDAAEISGVAELRYQTQNPADVIEVTDAVTSGGSTALLVQSDGTSGLPFLAYQLQQLVLDLSNGDTDNGIDSVHIENAVEGHGIASLSVITGAGPDELRISATTTELTLDADLGTGNDSVSLGNVAGAMQQLAGAVNLQGGEHATETTATAAVEVNGVHVEVTVAVGDRVLFSDFATTDPTSYSLSDTSITRGSAQPTTFAGFETIELFAASGSDLQILDTPDATSTDIRLREGTDKVTVVNTANNGILRIDAAGGSDAITLMNTGDNAIVEVHGGDGADRIDVAGTGMGAAMQWFGGAGDNHFAISGAGESSVFDITGGDDTDMAYIVSAGALASVGAWRFDGQAGTDHLSLDESASNIAETYVLGEDRIERSSAATSDVQFLNVESVEVKGGTGADLFHVRPSAVVAYTIHGGEPEGDVGTQPGDQLSVITAGLTNVVLPEGVTAGTVTAEGTLPVEFEGIELLDEGFVGDQYEPNDTVASATDLGEQISLMLMNLSLTAEDRDHFRIAPVDSGYVAVRAIAVVGTSAMTVRLLSDEGVVLATSIPAATESELVFPSVQGQSYVVEITSDGLLEQYSLEFRNAAVPIPTSISLDAASDTGALGDFITSHSRPRILIASDLSPFATAGIPLLSAEQMQASSTPGVGLRVLVDDQFAGFADPAPDSSSNWAFELADVAEGSHQISAMAVVVDPNQPPLVDNGLPSEPMLLTIDRTPPSIGSVTLVTSDDTGLFADDHVTGVSQVRFSSTSDRDTSITAIATNVDTGESQAVGQTTSDGDGNWQIQTSALADGRYDIEFRAADEAGNLAVADHSVWVDTLAPAAPVLDLVTDDGVSPTDNRTSVRRPTITIQVSDPPTSADGFANQVRYQIFLRPLKGASSEAIPVVSIELDSELPDSGTYTHTLSLDPNDPSGTPLGFGAYEVTAEVTDRAGNTSVAEPLNFVIEDQSDITPPPITDPPNLLEASDTGISFEDNITRLRALTFDGVNEVGADVRLLVSRQNSSQITTVDGRVGDDASDNILGNGLGRWQLTTPELADGTYHVSAHVTDAAGNSVDTDSLDVSIDSRPPATPSFDLLSDSGRSNSDRITNVTQPVLSVDTNETTVDGNPPFESPLLYDIFVRMTDGSDAGEYRVAGASGLIPSSTRHVHTIQSPQPFSSTGHFPSGEYRFRLTLQDVAGNVAPDTTMDVVIDIDEPVIYFGTASMQFDGLRVASDTGVPGQPATMRDRLTSETQPTFWGQTEPNALLELKVMSLSNPVLIADSIAGPVGLPTNPQRTNWELRPQIGLNDPELDLPLDGLRRILIDATDVAGNTARSELEIFLDTQAPTISAVNYRADEPVFHTGVGDTPTPLLQQLWITFNDAGTLGARELSTGFPASAVTPNLAADPRLYRVVGAATGLHSVSTIELISSGPAADGMSREYTVALSFDRPLPDDRYTLTISDNISDPAGNLLDGEIVQAADGDIAWPSGGGNPGGDFEAVFTIDARPEIGTWGAGHVTLDLNGNWLYDPSNVDLTNRDRQFLLGFASDDVFAGSFTPSPNSTTDGFDRLAAYGDVSMSFHVRQFRWLVDLDDDGVIDPGRGDIALLEPANVEGLPVAGNFDGNSNNGDEVGLFTGSVWWLDTNHDYQVDRAVPTALRGHPVVGDFNGDGRDDLGTYFEQRDEFQIDFATSSESRWDGTVDLTLRFGFPGVRERPAAADFDRDGIDDLVLWSPDHAVNRPQQPAHWYLLLSDGRSISERVQPSDDRGEAEIVFAGNDTLARFGNVFDLPIVGNFRAAPRENSPVTENGDPFVPSIHDSLGVVANPFFNSSRPTDVNNDGSVSPLDAVLVINELDRTTSGSANRAASGTLQTELTQVFWDTNNDGALSPLDALLVINALQDSAAPPRASLSAATVTRVNTCPNPLSAAAIDTVLASPDDTPWSTSANPFTRWQRDSMQRRGPRR